MNFQTSSKNSLPNQQSFSESSRENSSGKEIWRLSYQEVLTKLQTRPSGLTNEEAQKRLLEFGPNTISKKTLTFFELFIRQFTGNPLLIVLTAATFISFLLGQRISSYYIFAMINLSVFLGLYNEYSAEKVVNDLLKKISSTTLIFRNDDKQEIPVSQLTVGDIVYLSAGSIVPADIRLTTSKNLEVNQSALTGESKTVYKISDPIDDMPEGMGKIANMVFMGSSVVDGWAKGVVVNVGEDTEYGKIAKSTLFTKPETDFQKGLANFGKLLVNVILVLTFFIFFINALLGRPIIDSLLFALAIAVGLTPELLPVIVTVSLSHGAGKLATKKVVAKQLIAIEDLGNMDVLCTDKTGTLTEGNIELIDFVDPEGTKTPQVLISAMLANNAFIHHKVIGQGIDAAVWKYALKSKIHIPQNIVKVEEEPFDFNKKLMYAVIREGDTYSLVVKGAPEAVLNICNDLGDKSKLAKKFEDLNNDGLRIVAVATKKIARKKDYSWNDLKDLTLQGYLTFLDVPKVSAKIALMDLKRLNVTVKVITGDNEVVTQKVAKEVGIEVDTILTGKEMEKMTDEELSQKLDAGDIFARVVPEQKLRIIKLLQKKGHIVGFLGDGINDAPALHSADVGISVDGGVDVAKDASSIVLLQKSLDVIVDGIMEGRKTFNNTIKYILMGTSSNFGNMFSAAGASFFLPFLPMTPVQILLTNGLYDLSQLSIPSDNVDKESLIKPRHWDMRFIRNYMVFFGPISSLYDFLTYGVMYFVFHARDSLFQTGWFIESMATEILVVFVIRTSKSPFFLSKPGKWLLISCLGVVGTAALIPFSPLAASFGFVTPPPLYFIILVVLVTTYLLLVETLKKIFLKHYSL